MPRHAAGRAGGPGRREVGAGARALRGLPRAGAAGATGQWYNPRRMTAGRHLAARLALLLAAALATLLVAEGACSLLTGHGLLRWIAGPPAVIDAAPPTDAERRRAAANNPGP